MFTFKLFSVCHSLGQSVTGIVSILPYTSGKCFFWPDIILTSLVFLRIRFLTFGRIYSIRTNIRLNTEFDIQPDTKDILCYKFEFNKNPDPALKKI